MGGQDKGLLPLEGQPLYQHVLAGLSRQVSQVLINANRHVEQYRQSGLPVIPDVLPDFLGPLAGMQAGLQAAGTEWVVFVPCDVPVFPQDLVQRLWQKKRNATAAYANSGDRDHPAFALLNRSLLPQLELFLSRGERRVMLFFAQVHAQRVIFPSRATEFINLNTPQDLAAASERTPLNLLL